jgi:hypothetical protein
MLSNMDIIFACTVFQVSSDLQFKSEFSEEIQINELNLLTNDWKLCYNCPQMIHVGLHSVGTYHKKFGRQNKKNKNILCRVSNEDTRQRQLCGVPTGCRAFFGECLMKTLCLPSLLCRVSHSAKPLPIVFKASPSASDTRQSDWFR